MELHTLTLSLPAPVAGMLNAQAAALGLSAHEYIARVLVEAASVPVDELRAEAAGVEGADDDTTGAVVLRRSRVGADERGQPWELVAEDGGLSLLRPDRNRREA